MPFIILVLLLFASACAPKPAVVAPPAVPPPAMTTPGVAYATEIVVRAVPVPLNPLDSLQFTVGRLHYLGGLHLTSPDPRFGGLSGLRWHEGRLMAVSDEGDFFLLTTEEEGDRLTGVRDVRMQRLTRLDGTLLSGKAESDAEALEVMRLPETCPPPGPCSVWQAIIAFEGTNRLWRYPLVDGLPRGAPTEMDWAAEWRRALPSNGGVEAMAGGWLLAEAFREPDGQASGRKREWYQTGPAFDRLGTLQTRDVPLNLALAPDFSPTDADAGPDGNFTYVLQRRYVPGEGNTTRIVRFHRESVSEVEVLAEIGVPLTVDNFEGLAYRDNRGAYIYIVSDDNFSPTQRTLLMKFEILNR